MLKFHKVAWLYKSISFLNIAFMYLKDYFERNNVDYSYLLNFSNNRFVEQNLDFNWSHKIDRTFINSQHSNISNIKIRFDIDLNSIIIILIWILLKISN